MLVIEMQKYLEICMERTYRAQGMPRNDADDALAFNKGQQQQQQQHITGCQMKLPRWWCSLKNAREREMEVGREEAQFAVNADEQMQRLQQQQQLGRIMSTDEMQAYI